MNYIQSQGHVGGEEILFRVKFMLYPVNQSRVSSEEPTESE